MVADTAATILEGCFKLKRQGVSSLAKTIAVGGVTDVQQRVRIRAHQKLANRNSQLQTVIRWCGRSRNKPPAQAASKVCVLFLQFDEG